MKSFNPREGVPGFTASGIAAGIKKNGAKDLGLILGEQPCTAAGVFTRNRVKAAPILLCQRRLRNGKAQAVLVNSGNANACTGQTGPDGRGPALADQFRAPTQPRAASANVSATYRTSSSLRRDENGRASADAATRSATGKSPGRKPNVAR